MKNLDRKLIKVLDDGFIRVVDVMGDDKAIVQAARVSYGEGTKKYSEDRSLIRYLMRHRHTSPFEMCEIKFHLRVPMDCWRQWIRHRTANVNEYSTRYSIAINAVQKTSPNEWRYQSNVNKQGSSSYLEDKLGFDLTEKEKKIHDFCRQVYEDRINCGVAKEQARKDLPLSTYTEAYWKIDLHNLLHFLELRMDVNAQYEIRQYAGIIGEKIVSKWVPLTWEAFLDYRYNSISLSNDEIYLISMLNQQNINDMISDLYRKKWLKNNGDEIVRSREAIEFEIKLKKMGFHIPWSK